MIDTFWKAETSLEKIAKFCKRNAAVIVMVGGLTIASGCFGYYSYSHYQNYDSIQQDKIKFGSYLVTIQDYSSLEIDLKKAQAELPSVTNSKNVLRKIRKEYEEKIPTISTEITSIVTPYYPTVSKYSTTLDTYVKDIQQKKEHLTTKYNRMNKEMDKKGNNAALYAVLNLILGVASSIGAIALRLTYHDNQEKRHERTS